MKTFVLGAVLLLACGRLGAAAPEFDRREPISLDLKDAAVKEVITLLGALANLPVQIDPGVSGSVTVRVTDMPYDRVLNLVGEQTGISIRIEGGKLVASPATRRAGRAPAPEGPSAERKPAGPRLPVEDYARASGKPGLLVFRGSSNGVEFCALLASPENGGWKLEVPGQEAWTISPFGWEPVTRTRFLAIEGPGFTRALAVAEPEGGSGQVRNDLGAFSWSILPATADEPCPRPAAGRSNGRHLRVRLEVRERRDDGLALIRSPKISALASTAFSTRTGLEDEFGQHGESVIFGFLSSDARSIAAALLATATWKDPADGREYVYAQVPTGEISFGPPSREPSVIGALPAGAALRHPLELSIGPENEKNDADE
ncbi:MAG: hypothetical protein ABI592_12180 [Acidobacteriota bacterium]